MAIKVALAGNPNCGKTTLFNNLTGSKQHVGNWPGVTVDKKEGKYKKDKEVTILDLPGTYSLSPYSAEEIVARDYIVKEKPDVVINIVDGTSIERNLYLTLQIMETGIPMIIAMNMMDEVETRGDSIDCNKLSEFLGVPVVPIVARNKNGIDALMTKTIEVANKKEKYKKLDVFSKVMEEAIEEIKSLLNETCEDDAFWKAIKLLEGDEQITKKVPKELKVQVEKIIAKVEQESGMDMEASIADLRYQYIAKIVKQVVRKKQKGHIETTSDKVDKVLTNRILALPIFAVIMYLIFSITFGESIIGLGVWLQTIVCDFWDGPFTETIVNFITNAGAAKWAISLVQDGILAGLGGVVSFFPQILVLFLLLSFLEDSGYMARVAFVMDRIFRKFGLTGKSFIPLLMGFGCSVPAVMATRTLESEKDRKITMMITPFMSCGAKLPIYLMFIATLFPNENKTLLVYSIYLIGMIVAILSGIILNKLIGKGESSSFIMELPQYRIPTVKSVFIHGWEKVKGFAIKAGTVIFASTVLIWFLANFNLKGMCSMEDSILASIGNVIKYIFIPLGWGDWRAAVGAVTGFIAKENVVSTFGVLFGAAEDVMEAAAEGEAALPGVKGVFNQVTAFSYMAFNLLCMPCFAAVGAIKREMGSWKWTFKAIGFQMVTAWMVAFLISFIGGILF